MDRRLLRALEGVVIALGAPLGWLLIRWMQGSPPAAELRVALPLYLYMLIASVIVLALAGAVIGAREARLLMLNLRLEELAVTDPLTGLRNVRYFMTRLDEEMADHRRRLRPLAIVAMDLDHFKRVNDTYGHYTGDEVLKNVARAISSVTRHGETAARMGGEEFALLLPDSTGEAAREAAERARSAIAAAATRTGGDTIRITASAGVASTADLHQADAEALLRAADRALYAAKAAGRDLTVVEGIDERGG